jgi:hypothetical protein
MDRESAISAFESWAGIKLPTQYRNFLFLHEETIFGDRVLVYPAECLIERNETYESKTYCPGYIAIGDDGGDRVFVIPIEESPSPVFSVDQGVMDPDGFELVAKNFSEWVMIDCQIKDNTYMPSINDLDSFNLLPSSGEALKAIGWLGRGVTFNQGEVTEDFFAKLNSLCLSPWQPVGSAGIHSCGLCQFEPPRFSANIFVPHDGRIYVAPVAVTHYIAAHWYRPPEVFIRAVLECPTMNSMQYKKALLANGGRFLVKTSA